MFDPAVQTEQDRSVALPTVQSQRQSSDSQGFTSESQWRRKTRFLFLPSCICSSSSTADALPSPEMGWGCRRLRTNLAVLYMAVEREDICYMAVGWGRLAWVGERGNERGDWSARHLHLLRDLVLGVDVGAPAGQSAEDVPLGHLQAHGDWRYPGDGCRETRHVSLHVTQ